MRRFKQVKRKEVVFDLNEWRTVEEKANSISLKTGTFIKRMALDGKINYYSTKEVVPLVNSLRIIGNNINQIARKANEINSIYLNDIEKLKEEHESLCLMLNQFLSTLQSTAA